MKYYKKPDLYNILEHTVYSTVTALYWRVNIDTSLLNGVIFIDLKMPLITKFLYVNSSVMVWMTMRYCSLARIKLIEENSPVVVLSLMEFLMALL